MPNKSRWVVLALVGCLLFSGTLFFANLGKRDLWNPDEPRYAEVSREMVLNHAYLVPRLNRHVYTQKPPLFFWMAAGSFNVFHKINEWTARFPVALSAVLCVLFVFLIGKRLFDPWTGIFAALLLATTSEFFWLGNRVNFDTVMTLFILASLYAIVRGITDTRHSVAWLRLAFFLAGVATLTKGPLGIIVPFLTLIVYLVLKKDFKTLKGIPWVTGIGIFLLVLLLGLGPTCFFGGKAYTHELLFRQTLTRYLYGINHRKGFFYYFYTYPEALLPWVLFLPGAFLFAVKRWREKAARSSLLFVLVWLLANLLFISFSKSKRQLYILSLIPAGCLLVACYISAVYRKVFPPTFWFRVPVAIMGILALLMGIAFPFAPAGLKRFLPDLILPYRPFVLMGALLIVAGGCLTFLNGMKRTKATIWVLVLSLYAVFFVGTGWILPLFNPVRSPRALGEKIQALKDDGYDIRAMGGFEQTGVIFYTKTGYIPLISPVPWEMEFLKTSPKVAVVMRDRRVKEFAKVARLPLKVIWKARVGGRSYLILQPERTDLKKQEQ